MTQREYPLFQIDAFASAVFQGNPAAVIPLQDWLPDETLQSIASENNLSETAFFIPKGDGYHLRWFTPVHEVPLCGHATLAAAYVVFNHLKPELETVDFESLSGPLSVRQEGGRLVLNFPRLDLHPCDPPEDLLVGLGVRPIATYQTIEDANYYGIFRTEQEILDLEPSMDRLARLAPHGIVVTAPGTISDFSSRYFAPGGGIPEDPVTGSIHCGLIPYWSERLGKTEFYARQLSQRGGELHCKLVGNRVEIGGHAVQYLVGKISIEG